MTIEQKLDILDRIIFEDEGRHLENWEIYFLRTYWEITGGGHGYYKGCKDYKDCQDA